MEWIEKGKEHERAFKPIPASGLYKGTQYEWKDVLIEGYDNAEDKFIGRWAHNGAPARLSRIFLVFDVSELRNKFLTNLF